MTERAALDWSAVGQKTDPVKSDVDAIYEQAAAVAGHGSVFSDTASVMVKATGEHVYFVGSAAQSLDSYLLESRQGAQWLASVCSAVHDTLNTWAAWVDGYQSQADPKCREAMELRRQRGETARDYREAKETLEERRFKLTASKRHQRERENADLDPDSDLDTRVRNLTRKVDESQARCDALRNRLDGIDARLAELRRQVKDIADQYEGDAARIASSISDACETDNIRTGRFFGRMGNLQTSLAFTAAGGGMIQGFDEWSTYHEGGGRHISSTAKDFADYLHIRQQDINDALSGDALMREVSKRNNPAIDAWGKSVGGVSGDVLAEGAKGALASTGGSVAGGTLDGTGTYLDRVDTYGQEAAAQDGIAHGVISTTTGIAGAAAGAAIGAAAGSVVPGAGTAVGAVAGFLAGWVLGGVSNGLYDYSQKRGNGDTVGDHIQDNLDFWSVD